MRFSASVVLLALALSLAAAGQKKSEGEEDRGFTMVESVQGTANSDSTIVKVDSNLGFNFNKHFGVFAGIPFYVANNSVTPSTTATTTTGSNSGIGNVYLGFALRADRDKISYSSTSAVQGPTGGTSSGFSTGRVTADHTSRLEVNFDRVTPFFEGGLGNSVPDSRLISRAFTSLGMETHFEEGAEAELAKHFFAGFSGYQIVPFGTQKVFSKLVKSGKGNGNVVAVVNGKNNGKGKAVFETVAQTTGTDLTRENGFNTWVGFSPNKLLRAEVGFSRSTTFDLNSVVFNLSVNVGRLMRSQKGL
ncbi:MAG TPA: hypothetical protein VEW69_07430 [Alphaproteobacteria bacterium]|nr:hypothetical protein [Alphaproteobacteria bacterium]